jgi:riboflavin synthase
MFSGIIEHQGKILKREGGLFRVENKFPESELKLGQSIAHDGACMTITKYEKSYYEFFMMEESLRVTHFHTKKV